MAQSSETKYTSTPATQPTSSSPAAANPSQKGKIGRRALLAAGGIGACAVGAALVPVAVSELEKYASDQAHQALTDGIAQGEQAIINELAVLEGVALDDAIQIAEWTKLAVDFIVKPIATGVAFIGDGLLDGLNSALADLDGGLHAINIHVTQIHALRKMVQSWHDNLHNLPITLTAYGDADTLAALKYLRALKAKVQEKGCKTH
jgi:hypothetical protein